MATATRARAAMARPSHAPIPTSEFDRHELLAVEKESIGLFISAHPLKDVRAAMRTQGRLSTSASSAPAGTATG